MNSILFHFKKFDWILFSSVILLVVIGLLSLYSISLGSGSFLNLKKQIIFLITGLFLMFLISFLDWRTFSEDPHLILVLYFFSCLSLVGLFWFAPEIRGIKAWYKLGPLSLDPIEFCKIVLIILLAKYFTRRHVEMYGSRHIILSGLYFLTPIILIALQPDMGSVLILIVLWMGVLIVSGIKIRHFLILLFFFLLILILGWSTLLKDYQKERILGFLFPQLEFWGIGWSQAQAQIAIGSGGLFGQGLGSGSQIQLGFLPEPHTDFIFAAIAEEFGLIGIAILFLLFSVLIWRIIKIAISSRSNFPRLFASGFAILLVSQTFVHIGVNLGMIPVIGIPLPLISYGGSSLITTFTALGILQSIKTKK